MYLHISIFDLVEVVLPSLDRKPWLVVLLVNPNWNWNPSADRKLPDRQEGEESATF